MHLLLINPSWGTRVDRQRYNRCWPPVDLLYMAALLRQARHSVSFLDARATGGSPQSVYGEIRKADLVIINTSPLDRWQCPNLDLQPLLKWTGMVPTGKLILCGVHGTLFPEEMLRMTGARFVLRGEPEASVVPLVEALEGSGRWPSGAQSLSFLGSGAVHHTPSAPPVDMAALPIPAYDLTCPDHYEYELLGKRTAVLETARGCPHHCIYCLKTMYGTAVRFKPVERVAAEVEEVVGLGYRFAYFIDLEFTLSRRRVIELCKALKQFPLKWCCQSRVDTVDREILGIMAESGCTLIHYGMESGNRNILDAVRKGISRRQMEDAVRWAKAAGMSTAVFFLFGLPGETPSTWTETERLARHLNATYASFHLVTAYPGTPLARATGNDRPWWETAAHCARPDWQARLRRTYLRYYLRPAYWMELLKNGAYRPEAVRLFLDFLRRATPPPPACETSRPSTRENSHGTRP